MKLGLGLSLTGMQRRRDTLASVLPASVVSAHSVSRRLTTDYTGDLIRVRRESDNAETNIGFDSNGDLDEAALLAFTGDQAGDHGYIVTIYEQSGDANAVNLGQPTSSLQPFIVQDGAVVKAKGNPTALQSGAGSTHRWVGAAANWNTRPSSVTAFVCASFTAASGRDGFQVSLNTSDSSVYSLIARTASTSVGLALNSGTPSYFADASFIGVQGDGTTRGNLWSAFAEKGLVVQRHQSLSLSDSNWASLRTNYTASNSVDGLYEFSELIICSGADAGDISNIEANQAAFYGITLAGA